MNISSHPWLEPVTRQIQALMAANNARVASSSGVETGIAGLIAAIDWSEPFIIGILTMHVLLLTIAVFLRHALYTQVFVLLFCCGLSRAAEYINTWASQNWRHFSAVNYFDKTGIFFSAVVSAPLCAIAFAVVIMQVYQAGQLLIIVKRQQLRRQIAKKAGKSGAEADSVAAHDANALSETSVLPSSAEASQTKQRFSGKKKK